MLNLLTQIDWYYTALGTEDPAQKTILLVWTMTLNTGLSLFRDQG